ncbi:MAG: two-CW domain-containing protein [Desulfatibacillaceae bacterium]
MAQNCWEALRCGREKECPAYPDRGRACFNVRGTLCRNEKQGNYFEKIEACRAKCAFYKEVTGT